MLMATSSLRVFAHRDPTDMRKSFSGLVGLVETELGQQVESGDLFLFFNRRRDRVKVLYFVGDGLVIFYRMLERGTFEVPAATDANSNTAGVELRLSAGIIHPLVGLLRGARHSPLEEEPGDAARAAPPFPQTSMWCFRRAAR
jgi:transposase